MLTDAVTSREFARLLDIGQEQADLLFQIEAAGGVAEGLGGGSVAKEFVQLLSQFGPGLLAEAAGLFPPIPEEAAEKAAKKATAETEKKMGLEYIRNLMKTMKMTAQEAMDALQVPKDKQKEYMTLI